MDKNKCLILVPLYKETLDVDEKNSIDQLFRILGNHPISVFCPQSLNVSYYLEHYNFKDYYYFYDDYFNEYPKGYNSLLLNSGFYTYFSEYEYILIYQTDAWVFKDELEYWCNKGYDYIGAPRLYYWDYNKLHTEVTDVGNGGFSLRKLSWFIDNCKKYKGVADLIINQNSPVFGEDCFIAYVNDILHINCANIPSPLEAAEFSLDTDPNFFYQMTHKIPFGAHAYNKVVYKDFWKNIILYDNKKIFSVVTYIFGDYDLLREPECIDPMAEYICITNNHNLKSNIWKFIYDDEINSDKYNDWQRTLLARYKCLDYCNTGLCIHIDGSVQIKGSLFKYIYMFANYDALFMLHPYRSSFEEEYNEWINKRSLDISDKENFKSYCNNKGYDYNKQGIIMTTIMVQKNNEINKKLNQHVLSELMNNFDFSERVDQLYFSVIFDNEFYDKMKIDFLCLQALDSKSLQFYYHNSNISHSGEYNFNLSEKKFHIWRNKNTPCTYLI